MVESIFQVLLKQDINECGTGEGLQSVITQPQLQTYTHTHTQAGHPHREEKHIEREGGWYFGRSEKNLIANADLAGNVYFFVLQHKEVDCVSFQG